MLVASLEGKREQDILPRHYAHDAVCRVLAGVFSPKMHGAGLASLRSDGVKIGVRDNLKRKLGEMEDIARGLNSSDDHQPLGENRTPLKCLSALLHECNIQKQLLEDREGPLS